MKVNEYIDIYKSQRVLVIGDIILDVYYKGIVERISPEAPIPIIHVKEISYTLGGAANVVQNIAALGATAIAIGVIGEDLNGDVINGLFHKSVKNLLLRLPGHPTTSKIRAVSGNQQIVRMDFEESVKYTDELLEQLSYLIKNELPNIDVVVISDYNKGVVNKGLTDMIISNCKQLKIPVIVDPKGNNWDKYIDADVVTPNISELSDIVKLKIPNINNDILMHGNCIRNKYSIGELIVTRSHLGVTRIGDGIVEHIPTDAKEVFDVCGAGDTFISVLSIALAGKISMDNSIYLANKAAGIVVGKIGTATVTVEELFTTRAVYGKLIDSINPIKKLMTQGKQVVFTNGCFDILHVGHVAYLKEAKNLGDILVVGVNSDASIKRLKGDLRPVNNLSDRILLLEALECVDYIIAFDSDSPLDLIASIGPDILVKGGDYLGREIIGSEYAKQVKLINFLDGYSSTNIINKIRE